MTWQIFCRSLVTPRRAQREALRAPHGFPPYPPTISKATAGCAQVSRGILLIERRKDRQLCDKAHLGKEKDKKTEQSSTTTENLRVRTLLLESYARREGKSY